MKFRQLIFDALKARFEGVSDNILGRVADKLAMQAATEEAAKAAAEAVTMQQLFESYGDSRATEASKTAVKKYENKYNLKDGVSINSNNGGNAAGHDDGGTGANQQQGADSQIPAWAQALIDNSKKLADELAKIKRSKVTETRQTRLAEITSKLPESLRKAYARTPVDNLSDEEFSTLVTDITNEVSGMQADMNAKGAIFGQPSVVLGGNGGNTELTKEQMEAIAHREGKPNADAQPF